MTRKKQPNRTVAIIFLSIAALFIIISFIFLSVGFNCINKSCDLPTLERNEYGVVISVMITFGLQCLLMIGAPYLVFGIGLWKSRKWGQIGAIVTSSLWIIFCIYALGRFTNPIIVLFMTINIIVLYLLAINKNIRNSYS